MVPVDESAVNAEKRKIILLYLPDDCDIIPSSNERPSADEKGRLCVAVRDVPELKSDIIALKRSAGVAVLCHDYQEPDLADVADAVGDSVELARALRGMNVKKAVVCGVRYIAESISLLCPDREIVLAHPQSRCPMSAQVHPGRVRMWRDENPGVCVVCTVHFSAELKAECDLCVTQSNALEVMKASGAARMLLLADRSFGEYIRAALPDRQIELWPCRCPAMSATQAQDVELARVKWPDALLAANCCLHAQISQLADMTGSTAEIIDFCAATDRSVIIADEVSVCSRLRRLYPGRGLYQLAPSKLICSNMKLTGLETLERALKGEFGAPVGVSPAIAERALAPMTRAMSMIGETWDI